MRRRRSLPARSAAWQRNLLHRPQLVIDCDSDVSKRKKKRKPRATRRHTSLAQHRKVGSTLRPPLSDLNTIPLDWPRDLLPEHLWIASLAEEFGLDVCHGLYRVFCDAIDQYIPVTKQRPFCGLISDFARVPDELRLDFLRESAPAIKEFFFQPFGRLLAFYRDSPASWLLSPDWISAGGSLDPEEELPKLRRLVTMLLPGKDDFAGRVRAIPMARFLKHDKVRFNIDLPVVDLIGRYPTELTNDERYRVESTARQLINLSIQSEMEPSTFDWARYFWRHNYDIVPCRNRTASFAGPVPIRPDAADRLTGILVSNSDRIGKYIPQLKNSFRLDLYDPTKDEILFGLFSRITRLLSLLYKDPLLWSRDTGGIMLRCLADTAITFAFLAKKGTPEDFARFVKYGEGQQKLLMLQLQDNYPDDHSPDGLTAEKISEKLGGFQPELMDIQLGHWSGKDTRKLSAAAGFERLYRLVFSPTSADVHGTWISIESSNLEYCSEPLHRYHRLPSYTDPPVFLDTVMLAQEVYEQCLSVGVKELGYPKPINAPAASKFPAAFLAESASSAFASTRRSPWRWVKPISSRCSQIGIAYFRLVSSRSRISLSVRPSPSDNHCVSLARTSA